MAKRKRTATTRRRKRSGRRRTAAAVRTTRRSRVIYRSNPRKGRRRRRGGYRRNPGLIQGGIRLLKNSGLVLGGGIAGKTVSGLLPTFQDPLAESGKQAAVAYGLYMVARRFLGAEMADFVGVGAMQVPLKSLIVALAPESAKIQIADFLGEQGSYSLASYSDPAILPAPGGVSSYADAGYAEMYQG